MKRLIKILKRKKQNATNNLNLDEIMNEHGLDYALLNFDKSQSDVLKSFRELNQKLNREDVSLQNIRNVLPHVNFKQILKPVYTITITAVLLITTMVLFDLSKETEYTQISVDAGERITLHINNDVSVWLNSGSTIRIPMEIKRKAVFYLDGEAFIQVKKSKRRDYRFVSDGLEFTSGESEFHINSEYKPGELIAHVSKGEVDVNIPMLEKTKKMKIRQGEKISFVPAAGFMAKDFIHDKNYIAWKTQRLEFNNQALTDVADVLSNYYGIEIMVKNDSLKYEGFSATFINPTLDQVLDNIMANYKCNVTGDGNKLIIN